MFNFATARVSPPGSSDTNAREFLEGYFDFQHRHRDGPVVVAGLTMLTDLGLVDMVLGWRDRLEKDCRTVVCGFGDAPRPGLRTCPVYAALAALGA
ncbi:hypothetical protein [Mycobacterium persicum]|uniref:hypothetical protein n=1 Tax=Mycobacterium persicum TaxID=1487726 RepID=UPI00159394AD|nr:hypothetical protein [Mycobacterium persicum]